MEVECPSISIIDNAVGLDDVPNVLDLATESLSLSLVLYLTGLHINGVVL